MFQYLVDDNGLKDLFNEYGLFDRDIKFITELIDGPQKQKEDKTVITCTTFLINCVK